MYSVPSGIVSSCSMDPVHREVKTGSETWQNALHEEQLDKKERVIWE